MKHTIDVTPTWQAVLPLLLDTLESPRMSEDAKKIARAEVLRMAQVADQYVASVKARG